MNYDTTIFRECTIRLSKDTATIDEPVYVFKGDRNIKLKFNLQGLKYKFSEHPLDIYFETQQAAFCQVKWYRADDVKITFDIQSCDGGMPVLVIGEELMDEDVELGSYSIQIRLLDYNKNSILTLPLIENAVTIKAPVFEGGETQAYIAKADEGEVDKAKISVRGVVEDTYNTDGTYNKTTWNTGDIIAANKLNKSENAIEDIVGRINTLETTGGQQGPAGPQGEKGDKGDPGENGQTPNITIGTVTTVSSSTEASAEITGSTPNLVLNLSIPKGERGPEGTGGSGGTGADPTITIGTVTSGAVASASITGDYPDYTLNLVLPKGADGQDGTNGVDGVDGKDGLTTKITINGVSYEHRDGEITLPPYPTVPTKLSELQNDTDFVTEATITNRNYAVKDDIPTKLSELTDDVGHLTEVPIATTNTVGGIKADGVTLDVDSDGTLKYIGTVADTPTLTVGTVTKGDNAAASISGTAPNYTLNLTLPKGDAGAKGDNGETVAVSVNGSTYSHINGTITLPNYPTPRTDDEIKSLADGQIESSKQVLQFGDLKGITADSTLDDVAKAVPGGKMAILQSANFTNYLGLPHQMYTITINSLGYNRMQIFATSKYSDNDSYIGGCNNSSGVDVYDKWMKVITDKHVTTTINSSSTDEQIPTAKSLYANSVAKALNLNEAIPDNADLNDYLTPGVYSCYGANNAKTYLNCPTINSNFKLYVSQNTGGTKSFWGHQIIHATNPNGASIFYRAIALADRANKVANAYRPWQKVYVTSISDISKTIINTFDDETYVKPNKPNTCDYTVKDGICTLRLETACLATSVNFTKILSGLPKPMLILYENAINRNISINTDSRAVFQLSPAGNLYVTCNYGDESVEGARNFYVSFTYKVAEE